MDTLESIMRWAGGVAALVMIVVTLISVGRFRSRPAGTTVGRSPARLYSPLFLAVGSLISLAICVLLWRPIGLALPEWARAVALIAGSLLYFSGIGLVLWGRQALGRFHNVSSSMGAQLFADHQLVTAGPFSYVRHPMYLGFSLAAVGGLLLYGTWTMILIVLGIPVFVTRARREEEALIAAFGPEYEAYRSRVPAFFPRLSVRRPDGERP